MINHDKKVIQSELLHIGPVIADSSISTLMYYSILLRDIAGTEERETNARDFLKARNKSLPDEFISQTSIVTTETRQKILKEIVDTVSREERDISFSLNTAMEYVEAALDAAVIDAPVNLQETSIDTAARIIAMQNIFDVLNSDPARYNRNVIDSVRYDTSESEALPPSYPESA